MLDAFFSISWVPLVIGGGLLALLFFIASVIHVWEKSYMRGLVFAILELVSASISSSAWMWALKVSGKSDWFLFGLFGYTPFALIFICMFAVGVACIFFNARGLVKLQAVCEE